METTLLYLFAGCLGLGMLHGVIPDEHTWPITFAYSVGTTTGKGGIRSAGFFSLAFTLQRAIMSQLVYFAVAVFLVSTDALNGPVYVVVGAAMAIAGYLILKNKVPHFHPLMRLSQQDLAKHTTSSAAKYEEKTNVPIHWCIIHGFISGFGVDSGALSTFIYLTTLPALAKLGLWEIGWIPGFLFGIGTFLVLMAVGFFFGETLQAARRFGTHRVAEFGRRVGARTLLFGGIVFMILGPPYYFGVTNYIPFDFGSFIVLIVLVAIAVPTMIYTWNEVRKIPEIPSDMPSVPTT